MTEFMKDCLKSISIVALYVFIVLLIMYTAVSNADLYGSRSSFLTGELGDPSSWKKRYGMSLLYMSDGFGTAEERAAYKNKLIGNGDTHIDVYARAKTGGYHGITVDGYANQRARLQELNNSGLKPVVWLTGEGRQGDSKEPLSSTLLFIDHYVKTNDDLVAGYVVCLECDEQYSAAEVNTMVDRVKANTGKHVAVHLSPGVGGHSGNTNYYKGADFVYLQFGGHIHGNQVSDTQMALDMLKEALKLGIPVVANEYSIVSTSTQARALGDLLCQNGAAGTGNGRNINLCGQREAKKKKEWYQKYEKELIVSGIAAATLYAISGNDKISSEMFQLHANDNGYELQFKSGGYNLRYSENRIMSTYRIEF